MYDIRIKKGDDIDGMVDGDLPTLYFMDTYIGIPMGRG